MSVRSPGRAGVCIERACKACKGAVHMIWCGAELASCESLDDNALDKAEKYRPNTRSQIVRSSDMH